MRLKYNSTPTVMLPTYCYRGAALLYTLIILSHMFLRLFKAKMTLGIALPFEGNDYLKLD